MSSERARSESERKKLIDDVRFAATMRTRPTLRESDLPEGGHAITLGLPGIVNLWTAPDSDPGMDMNMDVALDIYKKANPDIPAVHAYGRAPVMPSPYTRSFAATYSSAFDEREEYVNVDGTMIHNCDCPEINDLDSTVMQGHVWKCQSCNAHWTRTTGDSYWTCNDGTNRMSYHSLDFSNLDVEQPKTIFDEIGDFRDAN